MLVFSRIHLFDFLCFQKNTQNFVMSSHLRCLNYIMHVFFLKVQLSHPYVAIGKMKVVIGLFLVAAETTEMWPNFHNLSELYSTLLTLPSRQWTSSSQLASLKITATWYKTNHLASEPSRRLQ